MLVTGFCSTLVLERISLNRLPLMGCPSWPSYHCGRARAGGHGRGRAGGEGGCRQAGPGPAVQFFSREERFRRGPPCAGSACAGPTLLALEDTQVHATETAQLPPPPPARPGPRPSPAPPGPALPSALTRYSAFWARAFTRTMQTRPCRPKQERAAVRPPQHRHAPSPHASPGLRPSGRRAPVLGPPDAIQRRPRSPAAAAASTGPTCGTGAPAHRAGGEALDADLLAGHKGLRVGKRRMGD